MRPPLVDELAVLRLQLGDRDRLTRPTVLRASWDGSDPALPRLSPELADLPADTLCKKVTLTASKVRGLLLCMLRVEAILGSLCLTFRLTPDQWRTGLFVSVTAANVATDSTVDG